MKKKLCVYPLLIFLLGLLSLKALFHPGLFVSHDGRDHVARIANFYQSLSEGNFIPRWAKNLNWGYGHPVVMFLYPLSSYLGSLFHFLGFSLVDSTKLVFAFGFIFSGLFMYLWIKEVWGREAGLMAGLLYMFAPYRFVDLYVRGAIGENMIFPFIPLVCFFLYKLSQKTEYRYLAGAAVSLGLMVLAHNALSLVFLPFLLFYMFYLSFHHKKPVVLLFYCFIVLLFAFSLAAFFWLPAFYEGKYTLREIVISPKELVKNFPAFSKFIWPAPAEANGLYFFVGWPQLLAFLISWLVFWQLRKKKQPAWLLVLACQNYFLISLLLMHKISFPIWQKITILQKFQFPWRLLSISVFTNSFLAAGVLAMIKSEKKKIIAVLLASCLAVLATRSLWRVNEYSFQPESFYTGIFPSTTDTGESSPRWSVRFMGKKPEEWVAVIEGEAEIKNLKRQVNLHTFTVQAAKRSRLVDNTLYFPGWQAFVNSQKTEIEFQDPAHRGLITFWLEPGEHEIKIAFRETRFRMTANLISVLGVVLLIIGGFLWPRFDKGYKSFVRVR